MNQPHLLCICFLSWRAPTYHGSSAFSTAETPYLICVVEYARLQKEKNSVLHGKPQSISPRLASINRDRSSQTRLSCGKAMDVERRSGGVGSDETPFLDHSTWRSLLASSRTESSSSLGRLKRVLLEKDAVTGDRAEYVRCGILPAVRSHGAIGIRPRHHMRVHGGTATCAHLHWETNRHKKIVQ